MQNVVGCAGGFQRMYMVRSKGKKTSPEKEEGEIPIFSPEEGGSILLQNVSI
jgi:hypothetical protein